MWLWLVPLVGGFVVGAKGKPTTKNKKVASIGSRTGIQWKVDDFPQAGILIVSGYGASMTLKRKGEGKGFDIVTSRGNDQTLKAMALDFLPEAPKS
jgi:hypothetical protein